MVLIGHNDSVAWTATVSKSVKFTAYRLALAAGNPRRYLIDGKPYDMQWHDAEVAVKQEDGSQKVEKRRMWRTHFGPVAVIGGIAEWTAESAWALRDANATNGQLLDHFYNINLAKSVGDIEQVCATIQANPWTNTMSADKTGKAFYSESHSTPNLSPQAIAEWKTLSKAPADGGDFIVNLAWGQGLILLDGSKGYNMWVEEAGSREPGLVPFAKTPHMTRDDFVLNANDSHWLTNPAQKLTGFPFPYGGEDELQSARTRMNIRLITEVKEGGASGADGKFTESELRAMILSGRNWLGDIYGPQVKDRCVGGPVDLPAQKTAVDLTDACAVLKAWDGTQHPDSKGAVLYREWYYRMGPVSQDAFDPQKPESTPNTLVAKPETGTDPVLLALATAVFDLQSASIALDATMGELQYTDRGGRISVPGGYHGEGAFNVISAPAATAGDTLLPMMAVSDYRFAKGTMTEDGYPVGYGTSFVMVADLQPTGVSAKAILTYSQSADPQSPHYADQTQLFSQNTFRPMLFAESDIAADPNFKSETVTVPAP
jgi:acyl-homoserine-lactone acylase